MHDASVCPHDQYDDVMKIDFGTQIDGGFLVVVVFCSVVVVVVTFIVVF